GAAPNEPQLHERRPALLARRAARATDPHGFARCTEPRDCLGVVSVHALPQVIAFPQFRGTSDAVQLAKCRRRAIRAFQSRARIDVLPPLQKVRERLDSDCLYLASCRRELTPAGLLEQPSGNPAESD